MISKDKIENIVKQRIETDEKLGDQAGGSGHMGNVSYRIDNIDTREIEDGKMEIAYKYTLITITEFTYYPDNPPYESSRENTVIIDLDEYRT
jgi:hypothetical protein